MISVQFQGKAFSIKVIQIYAPNTNAKEAEVEWFSEDLPDILGLTLKKKKKRCPFFTGNWNVKVGSQETPGVIGKLDLGVQNETRQRLTNFCQENAPVIANTPFK